MKVVELLGTDQQQIHITLAPENDAEVALVQILDQASAQLSAGAELKDADGKGGLLITAEIRNRNRTAVPMSR